MKTSQEALKKQAAQAALDYIHAGDIIGVGSGSTVSYFIEALGKMKNRIEGAVASSEKTANLLKEQGIPLLDLNSLNELPLYIDGTDEFNNHKYLIKGGGGALTREKIIAQVAKKFITIVDESKESAVLGKFPLPIEVIPMARSYVAREIAKLQGNPVYRQHVITDNGNVILDVHGWDIVNPVVMEEKLNQITGVVTHGIFAKRGADILLIATKNGIKTIT